jgi:DNA-binding HxlR family transcriptional regulator
LVSVNAHSSELCPRFHAAVELIGRRWSGAVIRLLLGGRRRYSDLRDAVPDISDRMLYERLKELETAGILCRIVTPQTPVRVEYELTDKGRALEAPLRALGEWASAWIEPAPEPMSKAVSR